MRLFLDVDGTLLRRSGHARLRGDFAPATNLLRFLQWADERFDCVWITSRTKHGAADKLLPVLRQAIGPGEEWDEIRALAESFETPVWDEFKAQAMNMDQDFLWVDDAPEPESLDLLDQNGKAGNWIAVDIEARPDDLRRVMDVIESRSMAQAAE